MVSTMHILQELELKGCITTKKPVITKMHLKARLSWSKQYEIWDADVWNKILFSNETKMELHSYK